MCKRARALVEQTAASVPAPGYRLATFMVTSSAKSSCTVAAICSPAPLASTNIHPMT